MEKNPWTKRSCDPGKGLIENEANTENQVSNQVLMASCKFLNPAIPDAGPVHGL